MKQSQNRWLSMAIVAGLGIGASSVALAHVDVGVNIGVPGVVYAPEPVYAPPPPPVYAPAPPVVVVSPGWYGERYYDGNRYWERREWEERHHGGREWHEARGPHGDWRGHDNGWHGHGDDRDHGHGHGDH
ncbi:hypothetical protein [Paraburkholderia phytofirmans]|uniref:Putative signal peptide protein n=1 Tax=Paraburkholderia phytofirmans (strain DSM 17436 / LMG 22146 / PsJN) TaxID=398527 RepID=B2T4V0_PARPJ|nr:hypothetical protein [Paraburkholderia phytofirmans]ACD16611.1 putative signal peptide protein [Paraburkholderia phytofirmans PsJN]